MRMVVQQHREQEESRKQIAESESAPSGEPTIFRQPGGRGDLERLLYGDGHWHDS